MKLRALAPAKINLSLFVGEPGHSGLHDIATLFQSVSLADEILAETLEDPGADEVICPGVAGENLAAKALAALRDCGWDGPRLRLTIDKRIPVAAGLGGGSADAAAALRIAMSIAPGRAEEVEAIAAGLGADVPSQLVPGVSIGSGTGEDVEHFAPLPENAVVLIPSAHQLLTADVYAEFDRSGRQRSDWEIANVYFLIVEAAERSQQVADDIAINDLQVPALTLCPDIAAALKALRDAGAHHAMVSGSGPTTFGTWWGEGAEAQAQAAAASLVSSFPGTVAATPVGVEFAAPTPL